MKPSGKVSLEELAKEFDDLLSIEDRMKIDKIVKSRKKSAVGSDRIKKQGKL
jgi:hypothetical protein